ncbi:MAG: hypothetical protein ACYS1A_08970 [Planctomycetota bacterium]|jgi:hypothetical protein
MANESLIKYHTQELLKLLEQEPKGTMLSTLCVPLENLILNNSRFSNIDAPSSSGMTNADAGGTGVVPKGKTISDTE